MNRATVKDDNILRVHAKGETVIGQLPKGVGLERLRWDGTQTVDLFDLVQIWVRPHGDSFSLHCREIFRQTGNDPVTGDPVMTSVTQLVAMAYADRKNLINDNGTIRLKAQAELDAETAAVAAEIVEQDETKTEFKTSDFATVTIGQAEAYIKNQFDTSAFDIDSVTDVETVKRELRKMVVGFERLRDTNVLMARFMIAQRNVIKRLVVR